MMTENKQKYLELVSEHTERELAQILNVNTRTIRRYAQEFGIKPKPTHYTNEPISVWKQRFETIYAGQIGLTSKIVRDKTGHIKAACKCLRCQTEWQINLNSKISSKTDSARQTMKDFEIPVTKLKKYVFLAGYQSISAWQADNKVDN